MEKWQEEIATHIMQGRELKVIMSGRNVGKSLFSAQALRRLWDDVNGRPIEDLTLSEGKIYGARYYCVEPVGGNWPEMEQWCLDSYGTCGSVWQSGRDHNKAYKAPEPGARWYTNNRKFWFRHEKDRDWFILRWR